MPAAVKQGIVSHKISGGVQSFLTKSGSNVSIEATGAAPTVVSFAHGSSNYLVYETSNVSNAWTGLSSPVDYWLYWDIHLTTGVVSYGSTTLEPIVSATEPASPAAGQLWFDTKTSQMKEYNGLRFVVKVRTLAAKLAGGATFEPAHGGSKFTGSQVGNPATIQAGTLIFDDAGNPLKKKNGEFFNTEDTIVSGTPSATALKASLRLIEGVASEPIPAYSLVKFDAFGSLALASPLDSDDKVIGFVEKTTSQGETARVLVEGSIFNPNWNWSTPNELIYVGSGGVAINTPGSAGSNPIGIAITPKSILMTSPVLIDVDSFVLNLGQLTDVNLQAGQNVGDTLVYNGTNWVAGNPVNTIDELEDVDTTTAAPNVGDTLAWDGTNWVPTNPVNSIDELTDVDTTTTAPNNGEVLIWDGTNWIPGEVAGKDQWQVVSTPTLAASKDALMVDTSGGPVTVTLPATPSANDFVKFSDYAGTWDVNNLTIARNGSLIEALAEDLTVDAANVDFTLVYVDGVRGWVVVD